MKKICVCDNNNMYEILINDNNDDINVNNDNVLMIIIWK